jgi:hypothetical protein
MLDLASSLQLHFPSLCYTSSLRAHPIKDESLPVITSRDQVPENVMGCFRYFSWRTACVMFYKLDSQALYLAGYKAGYQVRYQAGYRGSGKAIKPPSGTC